MTLIIGNTFSEALAARREGSAVALMTMERTGARKGQRGKVLDVFRALARRGELPCSAKTAAEILTAQRGENYLSKNAQNYTVIQRRISEVVAASGLVVVGDRKDPDGTVRAWYDFL